MKNEIKATICQVCSGRGVLPGSSNVCENCKGMGALGYDGVNEYFLKSDEKGNVVIAGVKPSVTKETVKGSKREKNSSKRSVFGYLLILVFVLIYIIFVAFHLIILKNTKVFWVITIILWGFVFLFLIYLTDTILKVASLFQNLFFDEPEDFIKEKKIREKKSRVEH